MASLTLQPFVVFSFENRGIKQCVKATVESDPVKHALFLIPRDCNWSNGVHSSLNVGLKWMRCLCLLACWEEILAYWKEVTLIDFAKSVFATHRLRRFRKFNDNCDFFSFYQKYPGQNFVLATGIILTRHSQSKLTSWLKLPNNIISKITVKKPPCEVTFSRSADRVPHVILWILLFRYRGGVKNNATK